MTATNEEFIRLRKDFLEFKKYKKLRNHSTYSDLLKKMTSCAIAQAEENKDFQPFFWLSKESIYGSHYALLEPYLIETYLKKGIELGESEAKRIYSKYLWNGIGASSHFLSLGRTNNSKAIKLLEELWSSEAGDNSVRLSLAVALIFFDPTEENIARSKDILLDLIEQEYTPAYEKYYRFFLFDAGAVIERQDEAFTLLSKAYELLSKQSNENWKIVLGEISYHLGLFYAEGIGCEKDTAKAKNLIRISFSKSNQNAYLWLRNKKIYPRLGVTEKNESNYDLKSFTVERFRELREKMNRWSASMEATGLSTKWSLEAEAVSCAKYLAEKRIYPEAAFWLCKNYSGSELRMGTDLEEGQYEYYLSQAAEKGHQGLQVQLAKYYTGMSPLMSPLQVDLVRAAEWIEKAAAAGNKEAQKYLACFLLDYRVAHRQESARRAERLLKRFICEGELWALSVYFDSNYFQTGKIREQPEEAFALIQKGAERAEKQGLKDNWSQKIYLLLGLCYAEGVGCKKDIGKAVEYMRKSVGAWHEKGEAYWWLLARNLLEVGKTEKARKA